MAELTLSEDVAALIEKFSARILIADHTPSRKSIRKLLSDLRIKGTLIDLTESFGKAIELTRSNRPSIIFSERELGDGRGMELLSVQSSTVDPNDSPRAFFLLSGNTSNAGASEAAEDGVDSFIMKPFTNGSLQSEFLEVIKRRFDPPTYERKFQIGRCLNQVSRWSDALDQFEQALSLEPEHAPAWAAKGVALQGLNEGDHAILAYRRSLELRPHHYRSLLGLTEIYESRSEFALAYSAAREMAEHHTIPLRRVPQLIRLSVYSQHYADVLAFYRDSDKIIQVASQDRNAATYLGAGLVVCGLYFLRIGERQSAGDAFRRAVIAGKRNPAIQIRAITLLTENNYANELGSLGKIVPAEIFSAREVRLAEFEAVRRRGVVDDVLRVGKALFSEGIHEASIHAELIRVSVRLKRSHHIVDGLLEEAVLAFPDQLEYFTNLAKGRDDDSSRA